MPFKEFGDDDILFCGEGSQVEENGVASPANEEFGRLFLERDREFRRRGVARTEFDEPRRKRAEGRVGA